MLKLLVFGLLVVLQCFSVVYVKHQKRLLHVELQQLYAQRDALHVEWSKLLLEQGTWESDQRVEKIAREQLGMVVPKKHILIVP